MYRLFVPTHVFFHLRGAIQSWPASVLSDQTLELRKTTQPFLVVVVCLFFIFPVCHFVVSFAANGCALSA